MYVELIYTLFLKVVFFLLLINYGLRGSVRAKPACDMAKRDILHISDFSQQLIPLLAVTVLTTQAENNTF